MLTDIHNPRLKYALVFAEELLYKSYYKDIKKGKEVNKGIYESTLNWFISLEEYEKCAKLVKYYGNG